MYYSTVRGSAVRGLSDGTSLKYLELLQYLFKHILVFTIAFRENILSIIL